MTRLGIMGVLVALAGAACSEAEDPKYVQATPTFIDVGPLAEGQMPLVLTLRVPILLPTAGDDAARQAIADKNGVPLASVPTARRDEAELSIEWALESQADTFAEIAVDVVGANEFFRYEPARFVIDPDEDDEPPALMDNRVYTLPPGRTITGVLREATVSEANQDMDGITRAGVDPFDAIYNQWRTPAVSGGTGGMLATIPGDMVAMLLQFDLTVSSPVPARFSAVLRVRDRSGRIDADETDLARFVVPSTMPFIPLMMPAP